MRPEDIDSLTVGGLLNEQVADATKRCSDSNLTTEDVRDYYREGIAYYKVQKYVAFIEEYPMTASGKIQQYELREAAIKRYGLGEAVGGETT